MGRLFFGNSLIKALSPIDEETRDPRCTAGDGHQRIYRNKIPLSRAGINIRGRSRRLKINYRTSEQIRKFAQGILKGVEIDDLDGGMAIELLVTIQHLKAWSQRLKHGPMNNLDQAGPLERCERYVASTRAREYLSVTVSGE